MTSERGIVVAARPGEVDVRMQPSADCAGCKACSPTGGVMLLSGVRTDSVLSPGDVVEIEVPPGARSSARTLVFVVPVLALVTGYLAGFLLGTRLGIGPDTLGAVVALACGAIALGALSRTRAARAGDDRYDVRVRAIIAQATAASREDDAVLRQGTYDRGGPERE